MSGTSDPVQELVQELVAAATNVANQVVDVAEEAAGTVLTALLEANRLIGAALEEATKKLVG